MTYSAANPVVSGVPYLVIEVDGGSPGAVEELTGRRTITVEGATGRHVVSGEAVLRDDGSVRLIEKDAGAGKDVRAWRIYAEPGRGLLAQS
ncbi:hypothetical protein [Georgenia sp. AZ-5]|uniref:hypothetical protein n=1 Tax=Georgenia sp. AZ-5 TaxID=3367526 RepID=UPI003754F80D